MMDTTEVQRFEPEYDDMEPQTQGSWVRAAEYAALAAKLAEVEAAMVASLQRENDTHDKLAGVTEDRDDALIALASARKQLERYIGEAEAALVAANNRIAELEAQNG